MVSVVAKTPIASAVWDCQRGDSLSVVISAYARPQAFRCDRLRLIVFDSGLLFDIGVSRVRLAVETFDTVAQRSRSHICSKVGK